MDREPAYSGCLAEIRSLENEDLEVREIPLEIQKTTEEEVEEKVEAQEETVEQNLDLIENYSLWLWLQKNKIGRASCRERV